MGLIDRFNGQYDFLSNFYPCKVTVDDLTFNSVEAAFQALKSTDVDVRRQFVDLSPSEAKRLGRRIDLRDDWDDVKVDVMEALLRQKFSDKNPELKEKLLSTGDDDLVEGNWWNDRFWGVCRGVGENNLGKLLMKIREELRRN